MINQNENPTGSRMLSFKKSVSYYVPLATDKQMDRRRHQSKLHTVWIRSLSIWQLQICMEI